MKTNRNFWPLGIIAVFLCFAAGMTTMVVLACRSNTDLVSHDYYEQEIRFQGRIDSLNRTKGLHASARYDVAGKSLLITLPAEHADKAVSGQIQLYRPAAAGLDQQFKLEPDAKGRQTLDLAALQNGLWKVRIAWTVSGQDYFLEQKIVVGAVEVANSRKR